ncbi:MAG TPA: ABC transporter permease [Baekduia sp.]|nr:ABC transporter permease [Baekduia sp.]
MASGSRTNPYGRPLRELFEGSMPYGRLRTMGEMGALGVTTLRGSVTRPFSWVHDAVEQISFAIRRCLLPLAVSHSVYLIGFGILLFGKEILTVLGVGDRLPGGIWLIWAREIATWITGMVFAGVVGAAITADLGARKVREELDALAVLGVERVRALVVPRVVATTIAMPVLAMLSLLIVQVVNFALAPPIIGFSHGVFLDNFAAGVYPTDLWFTMLVKNLILGFFVGVVACYKGLSAPGGAEGVGRAVNQTVIITFFGIWLFNSFFNLGYFTLVPDVAIPRG